MTNINKLKEMIAKDVEIVEHSSDPAKFIRNCFLPIPIKNLTFIERKNGKAATVEVDNKDKGRAIGRNGKNINKLFGLETKLHEGDLIVILPPVGGGYDLHRSSASR